MTKVEEYIRKCTRNCSNCSQGWHRNGVSIPTTYTPWLTPNHAREVAKIAREEVIEKACKWLGEHLLDYWSQSYTDNCDFIEDFKEAMEE